MPYPKRHDSQVGFPHCPRCDRWIWPSTLLCSRCHGPVEEKAWRGDARVVARVTVHRGVTPEHLARGPYRLVKVDCGGFFLITRWLSPDRAAVPGQSCVLRWDEVLGHPWPVAATRDE